MYELTIFLVGGEMEKHQFESKELAEATEQDYLNSCYDVYATAIRKTN